LDINIFHKLTIISIYLKKEWILLKVKNLIFCKLASRASNHRRIIFMFPPHAYFTALDFEARAGTVFDLFFSQAGYASGHGDSILRLIILSIKFAPI
jgi:hypothetical protein